MKHAAATPMSPRIAVVGSGPSGCYTAQFLLKQWPNATITIFDRLDTPYGLIRYGVAPDHLGTKAIAKQFARLFQSPQVRFVANVEVGRDVAVEDLRMDNDAVVLATGLWTDRTIDGFHDAEGSPSHAGVYGAGRLTRMVNGFPGADTSDVVLGRRVVVVGNGNVAVDLVRLILTPAPQLTDLGVPQAAIQALHGAPVERIDVVGRSAASRAKFDAAMIKELGALPDTRFVDDTPMDLAGAGEGAPSAASTVVTELTAGSPAAAGRQVHFHFGWVPQRLRGDHRVQAAVFQSSTTSNAVLELGTDAVLTAVGFTEAADDAILRRTLESGQSDLGRGVLADGLYCVGWLRRGPVGTIPANRADARLVADAVIADLIARNSEPAVMEMTGGTDDKEHA